MRNRRRTPFAINMRMLRFNTEGGGDAAGGGAGGGAGGAGGTEGGDNSANGTPNPAAGGDGVTPAAGGDGKTQETNAADWRTGWADELKNDPILKDFKDPQDIAKALLEAKKTPALKMPGADATDEERKAFNDAYREAMVPKDVKEYGLTKPEGLPPEMENLFSEEGLGKFGTLAQEIGLTKDQASRLATFDKERMVAQLEAGKAATQARVDAFMADFTKEHGANADKVLDTAGAIIDSTNSPREADIIKGAPAEVRQAVANVLHKVAQKYIGEDSLPGAGGNGGTGKTHEQLKNDLQTLMKKPEYSDPFHPDHQRTKDESMRISRQMEDLKKNTKR